MSYAVVGDDVILRSDPNYFNSNIAFNFRTFVTVQLSSVQYSFLQTLRESRIEASLFRRLSSLVFDATDNPDMVDYLFNEGFLRFSDRPPATSDSKNSIQVANLAPFCCTSSPTEVELCLTRRCNQTCHHCNVSAYSENRAERLPVQFWVDLIHQCEQASVLRLTITGGEPFVREGWDEILFTLAAARIGKIILTNGTLITDKQLQIMQRGTFSLSISLDGSTAAEHDSFRRSPGSFERTIQNMLRLKEAGIPFVISTVLHSDNVEHSTEIYSIAHKVGASRAIFVPMSRVGRANSIPSQKYFSEKRALDVSIEKLRRASIELPGPEVVLSSADVDVRVIVKISGKHDGATAMSKRNPGLCKAGIYSMAIDEDGLAYSCLRGLQERIFPIGDLTREPMTDIWRSAKWTPFRDTSIPLVPCRVEDLKRADSHALFDQPPL